MLLWLDLMGVDGQMNDDDGDGWGSPQLKVPYFNTVAAFIGGRL
jgi:hypothetical protein